jgi:hypothetical protein
MDPLKFLSIFLFVFFFLLLVVGYEQPYDRYYDSIYSLSLSLRLNQWINDCILNCDFINKKYNFINKLFVYNCIFKKLRFENTKNLQLQIAGTQMDTFLKTQNFKG